MNMDKVDDFLQDIICIIAKITLILILLALFPTIILSGIFACRWLLLAIGWLI